MAALERAYRSGCQGYPEQAIRALRLYQLGAPGGGHALLDSMPRGAGDFMSLLWMTADGTRVDVGDMEFFFGTNPPSDALPSAGCRDGAPIGARALLRSYYQALASQVGRRSRRRYIPRFLEISQLFGRKGAWDDLNANGGYTPFDVDSMFSALLASLMRGVPLSRLEFAARGTRFGGAAMEQATAALAAQGTKQAPPAHGAAASPAGSIGPLGVFVLDPFKGADGKTHASVGVHAGRAGRTDRAGRSGPAFATSGCIRTCGSAMSAIDTLQKTDPPQTLRVFHNRKSSECGKGAPFRDRSPAAGPQSPNPAQPGLLDVTYHPGSPQPGTVGERILSGIDVGKTTLPEVIARYGQPNSFREATGDAGGGSGPPGSGERLYTWIRDGVRMEVSTDFYTDTQTGSLVESPVASVAVWGRAPKGAIGVTGGGLALGALVSRARQIYGGDCNCGEYRRGTGAQNTHGFHYRYYLEYPRENYKQEEHGALVIDAGPNGRIVHIMVAAAP